MLYDQGRGVMPWPEGSDGTINHPVMDAPNISVAASPSTVPSIVFHNPIYQLSGAGHAAQKNSRRNKRSG